ncbi:thioredoxin family protein [Latilactobacillus sakei]
MEKLPVMSKKALDTKLKQGKYVLVFMADWCLDCHFIKPHLPEIESDFPDYQFIEVDRDENIDLAQALNIFGIPSFIAYQDGYEISRLVNKERKTKAEVEQFLNNITTNGGADK